MVEIIEEMPVTLKNPYEFRRKSIVTLEICREIADYCIKCDSRIENWELYRVRGSCTFSSESFGMDTVLPYTNRNGTSFYLCTLKLSVLEEKDD